VSRVMAVFHAKEPVATCELRRRVIGQVSSTEVSPQFNVRVLKPMNTDPFRSAHELTGPTLAAVVIIDVPAGIPLCDGYPSFIEFLQESVAGAFTSCHVGVMTQRIFKMDLLQPVHYLYFMKRRASFCLADYVDYYSNNHAHIGLKTRGIGYAQNSLDLEATQLLAECTGMQTLPFDSVSEMHFFSLAQLFALNDISEMRREAEADEQKFVDREASAMICLESVSESSDN
jgi:hypothetical protein